MAVVTLDPGATIQGEAGAMVSMSPGMTLETKAAGGLMASLKRSVLGRESFFMNTFRAPSGGGEITLAPTLRGDMVVRELRGETLLVQSGSYVASSEGINVDTT